MTTTKELTTVKVSAELYFWVNEDRVPHLWEGINGGTREEKIKALVLDIWNGYDVQAEGEGWDVDSQSVTNVLETDDFEWDEDLEEFTNYS